MNKWNFVFRFLFLEQIFIFINSQISSIEFDPSLDILLFDETCVYVYDNQDSIYKQKITENQASLISIEGEYKNKKLIKKYKSDNEFVLFALDSSNSLSYCYCKMSDSGSKKLRSLDFVINISDYSIKNINETSFLIYYIYNRDFYLHVINLDNIIPNDEIKRKNITYDDYYQLNTIECDSYDGVNIFCAYSTIRLSDLSNEFTTTCYYSFANIESDIKKNEIKQNIAGPALLKVETPNQKRFLICYYEPSNKEETNPSLYCQFFTQIQNNIIKDKIVFIGKASNQLIYENFIHRNLIQLFNYNYTIYINLKLNGNGNKEISMVFATSIDLNLIFPYFIETQLLKAYTNILLSNKYILFLTNENSKIKIEPVEFKAICPKNNEELYILHKGEETSLKKLLIQLDTGKLVYITFDLEPLTNIYINHVQNMGGLLYTSQLNEINNINLQYNKDLRITYNYYIYHSKNEITEPSKDPAYTIFSQFCRLKVVNCYESCAECNEDIPGTEELNQCSSCNGDGDYNKFEFDLEVEQPYFNCYKSDDSRVENHYYLNGNKYEKCNESCKSCENGISCKECNSGYYYKYEEFIDSKLQGLCNDSTPLYYYLNITGDIKTYKKCYKTCSTCFGDGNELNNNCIDCRGNYTQYPYDYSKCTTKIDSCNKYWKINETKNVECLDECDNYIIHQDSNGNRNQCVEDCTNYLNPNSIYTNGSLLNYTCKDNQGIVRKYCITLEFCKLKRLHYNGEKSTCESENPCVNMSDYSETPLITDELDNDRISNRTTIVKYFEFNVGFSEIKNFTNLQINKYLSELKKELDTHDYQNGIDLITVNKYKDFKIVLYPLDKEDYLYKNVIKSNNLGFFTFYEIFKDRQIVEDIKNITVGLIEFIYNNYPINSINYFFFEYEDKFNDGEFQAKEIRKESLVKDSPFQINIEYPLRDYNNPEIVDSYSSNLISTIKALNLIDENANFFDVQSKFYTDICTPFTSEIGTDMTLYDRTESYSTQISFCENGCELINLIDKGEDENPRALCQCNFKTDLIRDENYYNFIYEKTEGKNEENINVLKCATTAFNYKEVDNNFVFWIFIFFIIIFAVVVLIIIFCGKKTVEDILKTKKVEDEIEEEKEDEKKENKNKENIYNISDKISSVHSDDKYQSIDVKDNKSNSQKAIISSKLSYASPPPKKPKETNSTKENNHIASGVESINTTINLNNKIELKFKNDEDIFDEIFPDYNEVLNSNYYENKFMKNNYINLKLTNLKLKKYFLSPIEKDELVKHNNTDDEDNLDDLNYAKYKTKKSGMFNYYQTLLPQADISKNFLKNHYKRERFKTDENINNDDKNKNYVLKNSIKFFEDTDFLGDEQNNQIILKNKDKTKIPLKNSKELIDNENFDKNNIFIHKKKKSKFDSSINYEKKSDNSSRAVSLDKFFLSSSNINQDNKTQYSFIKFYWLYLNKREFCLISIYNIQENITSLIRITTFIFVISLQFSINCLFLTANQIHERHIYKKEHGSINEFTYIFIKEAGVLFTNVFIYLIIKMLFIKFIYEKLFRISSRAKDELSPFEKEEEPEKEEKPENVENNPENAENMENEEQEEKEEKEEKKELSEKSKKRIAYIKKYNKKSLIYIGIIFALMILLGYISVCYIGTFKNTKGGLVLRFIIAFIFSIIICAIFCLIVVTLYHFWRKTENTCLKIAYNICKIIY